MRVNSENIILPGCIIDGVQGDLEAIIDKPSGINSSHVAVCCHPHPQHGGAMGNKVIYTASKTFAMLGITSIRFNFRGVGKSDGQYDDGNGEQEDLHAVVSWVSSNYPDHKLILAGFSFGARIAAMQASKLTPCVLVSIAPPIGFMTFTGFTPPDCPWLIVQGDADELLVADEVQAWAESFEPKPDFFRMPEASHFFHGKLNEIRGVISDFTARHLAL